MQPELYTFVEPNMSPLPILLSAPHSGTFLPQDIQEKMTPAGLEVGDTDWAVDELYKFGPEIGIPLIKANYSRYVIDLNRDPSEKKLYADTRAETALVPQQSFAGAPLYKEGVQIETTKRLDQYYLPYHNRIQSELAKLRQTYSHVLLFDCHSIKRRVPSIRSEAFPDLILGSADETSAEPLLVSSALDQMQQSGFDFTHNKPFKGGYITRRFGDPAVGIHALQLEMSQDLYMNDTEDKLDSHRFFKVQTFLKDLLLNLSDTLRGLA